MLFFSHRLLAGLVGLIVLCSVARVQADPILEPNNSAATATILNSGQFTISDSLSANAGRPDTLLGLWDPEYTTLLDSDDNDSSLGNGFASQLTFVPLNENGSAYFMITGAGDTDFIGAHSQTGQYYVRFDLYDSNYDFFKTLPLKYESVSPNMVDSMWVNPPAIPEPERDGGYVTATIENIVGPGDGDSLDFFLFSGLQPNQPFTATLTADFSARLGLFGGPSKTLQASSGAPTPTISGVADGLGRALFGISGLDDTEFGGVHAEVGTYTLTVAPIAVPEPGSVALLAAGVATLAIWRRRRRR